MKRAFDSICRAWVGAGVTLLLGCGGQSASAPPPAPDQAAASPTTPAHASTGGTPDTPHGDPAHHGSHPHHEHSGHPEPSQETTHPHDHGGDSGYQMDFSKADRFASHFDDPKRDAWQKPAEVLGLLSLEPGMVVVDLGAGTGYFVGRLSKAVGSGGKVFALDAEPNMVEHVKERAKTAGLDNVVTTTVAPNDPGLAESSVDRVLIVNTWHHIGNRERYAGKLRNALEPGGYVLIVDFTADSDIGPPAKHRLAPEQVVRELEAGGLEATVVAESLPKQYVVKGVRP